jgi:hypothetical protein
MYKIYPQPEGNRTPSPNRDPSNRLSPDNGIRLEESDAAADAAIIDAGLALIKTPQDLSTSTRQLRPPAPEGKSWTSKEDEQKYCKCSIL